MRLARARMGRALQPRAKIDTAIEDAQNADAITFGLTCLRALDFAFKVPVHGLKTSTKKQTVPKAFSVATVQ